MQFFITFNRQIVTSACRNQAYFNNHYYWFAGQNIAILKSSQNVKNITKSPPPPHTRLLQRQYMCIYIYSLKFVYIFCWVWIAFTLQVKEVLWLPEHEDVYHYMYKFILFHRTCLFQNANHKKVGFSN